MGSLRLEELLVPGVPFSRIVGASRARGRGLGSGLVLHVVGVYHTHR